MLNVAQHLLVLSAAQLVENVVSFLFTQTNNNNDKNQELQHKTRKYLRYIHPIPTCCKMVTVWLKWWCSIVDVL